MIFGSSKGEEIKEVFLVVGGHGDSILFKYCHKLMMRDEVRSPTATLSFTLEPDTV